MYDVYDCVPVYVIVCLCDCVCLCVRVSVRARACVCVWVHACGCMDARMCSPPKQTAQALIGCYTPAGT